MQGNSEEITARHAEKRSAIAEQVRKRHRNALRLVKREKGRNY